MNILFITLKSFSATGGIEKFNRCLGKALAAGAQSELWRFNMLSAYDELSQDVYVPAKHFRGFSKLWLAFATQAWRSIQRADIILLGHINLGPLTLLAQIFYPRKKWILMAHGYELWSALPLLKRMALRRCTEIWAVSEFTRQKLLLVQQIPAERVRVFYNTLDPFFAQSGIHPPVAALRKRYGFEDMDQIMLTLCRQAATEENKGYEKLIRLMPQLIQQNPRLKLLLAGKADEAENQKLQQLIRGLNLENRVIRPGFIAEDELAAHYALADIYTMPSSKEGFGIVLMEAAWMGLPVIAGNADGSAEALLKGKLGVLVNPDSDEELIAAISTELEKGFQPDRMANNRSLIIAHFGFAAMKERLRRFLHESSGLYA